MCQEGSAKNIKKSLFVTFDQIDKLRKNLGTSYAVDWISDAIVRGTLANLKNKEVKLNLTNKMKYKSTLPV